MGLNDVLTVKRNGGLGRRNPSEDMVSGLVQHGVAVAGKVVLGTPYQLKSITDAQDLGLDADYDTANSVLVYHHILEFFRLNPDGELWIMLAPQATTWSFLVDPTKAFAPVLLDAAEGKIRQLAVAFNPEALYAPVIADGLDTQVIATIAQAQLLAEVRGTEHSPLSILVEARSFSGNTATVKDLRTLSAPKVSVVIGNDPDVAANYAAVGTLLGIVSKAKVNECVAWVERFNLTDVNRGKFLKVGFSGGIASLSTSNQEALNAKGYIFMRKHVGIAGVYFNDSHTAEVLTSDFCTIENNRTFDKAHRLTRAALLPKLASPLVVDQDSGRLATEVAKSFEAIGNAALDEMVRAGELSGKDVYVDEAQNVLGISRLDVEFALTPTGTARTIRNIIGFVNSFN